MGNKITRVVVEGSQGDINSAVSPISFFAIFFNILPSLVRIERGTKYTLFMSVTTQKNALFLISFLLKVFSVGLHTLHWWVLEIHTMSVTFLKSKEKTQIMPPFGKLTLTWGYLCSSQLNFPAFYAKQDFLRGENSLFTSSARPTLKQSWTSVNLRLLLYTFFFSISNHHSSLLEPNFLIKIYISITWYLCHICQT